MTPPEVDPARLERSMRRLMTVQPPRRDASRSPARTRLAAAAVACAVVAATAAAIVGGVAVLNHHSPGAPARTSPPVAVTSRTPAPSPSPTVSSGGPYLAATSAPCTADQLEVRTGQQGGAGGSGYLYLIVTNRSSKPCTLRGTPPLRLLDGSGADLSTPAVVNTPSGMFPTLPNDGVELVPLADQGSPPGPLPEGGVRGQASLPLQYAHDGCSNRIAAASLLIAGRLSTVPLSIPGAATGCAITEIDVNPFQPAEYAP